VRAPIALGVATIALRNPTFAFALFEKSASKEVITLLGEGFDMLEEDYEEEGFFATVRKGYWQAAEGSPTRKVGQSLIEKLEF